MNEERRPFPDPSPTRAESEADDLVLTDSFEQAERPRRGYGFAGKRLRQVGWWLADRTPWGWDEEAELEIEAMIETEAEANGR